jgi:sulfate permease, SulP family
MTGPQAIVSLRGDIAGGVTATFVALADSIAYGIIVFAPLGSEFVPLGVIAGLIALGFSNLGATAYGGVRVLNNGPFSLSSLMLASALTIIIQNVTGDTATALGYLFLIVFASGLLQVVFGFLRLGNLAKYIPYPVTAGLSNGAAILILTGQIGPLLGLESSVSGLDAGSLAANFQPLTLFVGLATVVVIAYTPKITKAMPGPLVGLLVGSAIYYLLTLLGNGQPLGPIVGAIPSLIPTPKYFVEFGTILGDTDLLTLATDLGPLVGGVAVVLSFETLLVSVSIDNMTQERSDTNRELVGQGLGNMLAAIFGGITSAGNSTPTIASYRAGGRTRLSKFVGGIFALAVLVLLGRLVGLLPKVVLSGVLVIVAFGEVDTWTVGLVRRFFSKEGSRRGLSADLSIVILVAGITVAVGIFQAVGAGLVIALALFIYRMSRETIRREYDASRVRSNVDRQQEELELLEQQGHRIKIIELEGALFFGTTDRLAAHIDPARQVEVDFVILDIGHVSNIDSTGGNILVQLHNKYQAFGKTLVLSGVNAQEAKVSTLLASGALDTIGLESFFHTVDDALAWVEDRLLDGLIDAGRYDTEISLAEVDALRQFTQPEMETFDQFFSKHEFEPDAVIFRQGGPANRLYIILKGRADIYTDYDDLSRRNRISTLCSGTVLGEVEVFDRKARAASAVANGQLTCYVITLQDLETLAQEHPKIAFKFLTGLGRELAKRIRIMNALATELRT